MSEEEGSLNPSSIQLLHDKLSVIRKEVIDSMMEKEDESNRNILDNYYSYESSEMEAWKLIIDSKRYLDDNVNIGHVPWSSINRINIKEKVIIIENHIGIRRDGNPLPLSIWEKLWFGNYKMKLINKVDKVFFYLACV
jgi:hypothetical protein